MHGIRLQHQRSDATDHVAPHAGPSRGRHVPGVCARVDPVTAMA